MSAILSADDLNDFISPGLACIKPAEVKNPAPTPKNPITGEFEIQIDTDGNATEVTKEGTSSKLQQAQISLADCLACSGCITSAEEVLVAQHSHKELVNALKSNQDGSKVFVMSISHQSRCSLAGALQLTVGQLDKFLIHLFVNKLGFTNVVGTGLGRKIATEQITDDIITTKSSNNRKTKGPILSSVCPGWVLYAEKTHPYILPLMNTVKSPQQITGELLKRLTSLERQVGVDKVYHLSIMPCFDKKLESARPEIYDQVQDTEIKDVDVDCVITPKELIQLLQDEEIDIDSILKEVALDTTEIGAIYNRYAPNGWLTPVGDSWLNDEGSASGGYALQYLLKLKERYLYENTNSNENSVQLRVIEGRNSDIYELRLVDTTTDQVLGSSGVVNGFKNIQNLVRKLKLITGPAGAKKVIGAGVGGGLRARRRARELAKKGVVDGEGDATSGVTNNITQVTVQPVEVADISTCDFVEVMACPGGCINGGGQIAGPVEKNPKVWTEEIEGLYNSIPVSEVEKEVLRGWVDGFLNEFGVSADRLTRTYFKEVEKPTDTASIALGSKW